MTTTPSELPVAGLVKRLTLYGTFFAEGMTQPDTLPEEAADALTAQAQRIAELEGLVRRAAINLSETAYPRWHDDARTALANTMKEEPDA